MPVTVTQTLLRLRTYMLGPEDPNPPYHRTGLWSIYPYTLLDDIGAEPVERDYRAVVLENDYVRVTILPELGGRVHSLFDKSSGQEAFYCNRVVKPGLVALRGAWLAGGLEFNYPAGHHCNTTSPVGCRVVEGGDGSVTCWVGALEHTTRMKWVVGIRLRPGSSAMETHVRVFNPTALRGRLYFWENAAVAAPDDLELVYPTRWAVLAGGSEMVTYPITQDGRDISKYRNHLYWNDIFSIGANERFFGSYIPGRDSGVIHTGSFRDAVGKKFFTWGTAHSGLVWADILSDEDGPYCEIQAGRFATQGMWEFLGPGRVESWDGAWWPVHSIGGFSWASDDVAVGIRRCGEAVEVVACPSRELRGATVELVREGQVVWSWSGALTPALPLRRPARGIGAAEGLSIRVRQGNTCLLDCAYGQEPRVDETAVDPFRTPRVPEDELSPSGLCHAGASAEKLGAYREANRLYAKALERDPELAPARLGLALVALRAARWGDAAADASRALALDPDLGHARYLLGLAQLGMGLRDAAENNLWRAERDPEIGAAALYALAEIALADDRPAEALRLLRRAGVVGTRCPRTAWLGALCLRALGRCYEASEAVDRALARLDPTDSLLALERILGAHTGDAREEAERDLVACTRGLAGDYLEASWAYAGVGREDDALAVLALGIEHGPGAHEPLCAQEPRGLDPMLHYTAAYLHHRGGRTEEAETALDEGAACSHRGIFPHRTEELGVLRWVTEARPSNAAAHLLLGNLLRHLARDAEAETEWQEAVRLDPSLAVAHRNLGLLAWARGDLEAAERYYESARDSNRYDYRYARDLDDIARSLRRPVEGRLAALESAPPEVSARQDIAWRRAVLLTATGRYHEAIELLRAHTFRPWEGAVSMRRVYVEALVARGRHRMAAESAEAAREDFEAALDYPPNIGVGRPPKPADAKALWWAGRVRGILGDREGSEEALGAVISEEHAPGSEGCYFQVLALRALGRPEADEAARSFVGAAAARAAEQPQSADARLCLGLAALLEGRTGDAARAFAEAAELDPQLAEARVQLEELR